MSYTERFSEVHNPLTQGYSDSWAVGGHNSSYVSLQNYHRAVVVINVGDMGNSATLDFSILEATSTAGAGSQTLTGKGTTQLTQASGDGDDLLCIEIRTEELTVSSNYDCIALRAVVGTNPVEYGFIVYGIEPRFPPVGTTNWAEVVT